MRTVLIVANETASGGHVRSRVAEEMARGPVRFLLLVPAVSGRAGQLTWNEQKSWADATDRMRTAVEALRALGATVEGRVGSHDALAAALDVLRAERVDEVWVSTLPSPLSRWLHIDLPSRIGRATGLPVVRLPVPELAEA